jgi:hypothetical protein
MELIIELLLRAAHKSYYSRVKRGDCDSVVVTGLIIDVVANTLIAVEDDLTNVVQLQLNQSSLPNRE